MDDGKPSVEYPVFVTEKKDGYDLRIRELILLVHGRDLRSAHEELVRRKVEIFSCAQSIGASDELPLPVAPPPLNKYEIDSAFGRAAFRLRSFWQRIF